MGSYIYCVWNTPISNILQIIDTKIADNEELQTYLLDYCNESIGDILCDFVAVPRRPEDIYF